jgi:peptidoglycan/LPS O-acetylase OafA/YrhL
MKYRTEIDGLRAIAILPVIWLHSGLPYLSGGFLGVDVFFVISGFLITNILLKDFESNTFSLVKFYERRARRILPALFFVILVTSVVIPLVSSQPKFLDDYGLSVLSTIFFSSNIYFWQTSGYFGSASELSPMLHTWSLAVEEQFYILFPLMIMLLFSRGRNLIVLAISLVAVASLMIAEWGALNSPNGNFYLLASRAWELMAGALAAIFYSGSIIAKVRESFSDWLAVIGVVLILSAYYFFSSATSHPSSLTIWPVLGAVLILLFCTPKSFLGQVLSSRPLHFVGLISYSLYLWHQPVLALMKKSYSIHLEPLQIVGAIILIFALSYVSWRFIENPFRDKQRYTPIRIYRFSFSGILIVALVGLMFTLNTDFQRVISPEKMFRYDQMLAAHESHSKQTMFDEDCKFWSA